MAIEEIPRSFKYTCDKCGKVHIQENAAGYYTDSRPDHWSRLVLERTAYAWDGTAAADATVKLLLCQECTDKVALAINNAGLDSPLVGGE